MSEKRVREYNKRRFLLMSKTIKLYQLSEISLAKLVYDLDHLIQSLENIDTKWLETLASEWYTFEVIYSVMLSENRNNISYYDKKRVDKSLHKMNNIVVFYMIKYDRQQLLSLLKKIEFYQSSKITLKQLVLYFEEFINYLECLSASNVLVNLFRKESDNIDSLYWIILGESDSESVKDYISVVNSSLNKIALSVKTYLQENLNS